MKQERLIRKIEKIRNELNHYNFLFIDMKDGKPEVRLSWKGRYESLYKQCLNDCRKYETEINNFYNILVCNIITNGSYDIDLQKRWENIANAFNCIKNNMRQMIIKC